MTTHIILIFTLSLGFVSVGSAADQKPSSGVQLTQLTNRVRVEVNGRLLTKYYFKDVPRPYCYPLMGPGNEAMTRKWPMEEFPNEEHDHPHHRSVWFAHGNVNGKDFWSEVKGAGKIVHESFKTVKSGRKEGTIHAKDRWLADDGTVVCTDEQILRFYAPEPDGGQLLDVEMKLFASNGELTFGDTKEGTMAVRVAETMRLKGKTGHGHIVQSTGVKDEETWGRKADWCDYYGPVDGKTVGIAMFDNPANPRHPTWWHVRDYGLFAANPFGQHDFEHLPDKTAGNLVVPSGKSVTFKYRLYIHSGDEKTAKVAEHYQRYIAGSK